MICKRFSMYSTICQLDISRFDDDISDLIWKNTKGVEKAGNSHNIVNLNTNLT